MKEIGYRVGAHPILGPASESEEVEFHWRGQALKARSGETVSAALMAAGILELGRGASGARGLYCAIGHCMQCRIVIEGQGVQQACLVSIDGGERIEPLVDPMIDREASGGEEP